MGEDGEDTSTTELDSHANMVVVGKHSTVISRTGNHADVHAFSDDCNHLPKIPIVDAALAYDCPYTGKTFILVVKNALFIESMERNLIPPFIMREAGLIVNEVPRIHCENDLDNESHCIMCREVGLKIPLRLRGIFSYFPTRALNQDEIDAEEEYDMVYLTPDTSTWNPYAEGYTDLENHYLADNGEINEPPRKKRRQIIEEMDLDDDEAQTLNVSAMQWEAAIDKMVIDDPNWMEPSLHPSGERLFDDGAIDCSSADVVDITSTLDEDFLSKLLSERHAYASIASAAGCSPVPIPSDEPSDGLFLNLAEASAAHAEIPKGVTKEMLAKVWRISEEDARRTLEVTTQLNRQDGDSSIAQRASTNDRMLRYRRLNSCFFMDTFFASVKSARGFNCMQIFVSDKGYVKVYGMKSVTEIPQAVKLFAKEVGAPNVFVCDPHRNQTDKKIREFCLKIGTTLRALEESTQHANRAELYVGLIKEGIRRDMRDENSPMRLWCFCAERRSSIFNLTAKNLFQLEGQNPHLATFGEMGDISNLCNFKWYEWVYFRQHKASFPHNKEELGRCLGPTKNEGNEMCQWVIQANGQIVPRRTLRRLTPAEASPHNEAEAAKRAAVDAAIRARWGDSIQEGPQEALHQDPPPVVQSEEDADDFINANDVIDFDPDTFTPYQDDVEAPAVVPEADIIDSTGKPVNQQSTADLLINAEVLLPQGEKDMMAKVVRRVVDSDGKAVGTYNSNPILNTMVYECEFPDGAVKEYAANVIAENILKQVDSTGRQTHVMDGIVGHRKNGQALTKDNAYIVTKRGRKKLRQTTIGWDFEVQWKDGTSQWVPLKLLKESNPVDVAEYVKARNLADEPAFAWWVPYTLKKRDKIIAAVNSRVKRKTHKYGIEIPTSVAHAREIDARNGNRFWQDAIEKEMFNVSIAFEILENDQNMPVGWTKSSGHLVFDVKMDFTRKARWVKDGHKHPDPDASNYAGVVSRESVRIALTYAALNDLDVLAADIRNAYLQAPSSEKHYIICGPEFGLEHEGKRAKIVRALYGGKVSGRDFWVHLRSCMQDTLGFISCPADPDVWMRKQKKVDGTEYWEYVLLYVDDALVISDRAESTLRNEIGKYFELKEESVGPPKIYLGGQMRKVQLENGVNAWTFGSAQYVKAAVTNVKEYLAERGKVLPRAKTPLSNGYRPEIDITDELGEAEASYYQSLIGILRWMVELGRVDICCEVSMMSSHLALPRKGHLEQLFHMFGYLDKHHNAEMPYDPTEPEINEEQFERQDWTQSIYGDVKEELPPNMPQALGRGFRMRTYVDSDHAGESLTRRSRTGFFVFLNRAPIHWMSKKQTSCETSTFGSEFVAMKQATEYVRGLRYKLRMMGIPCHEPTYVYGDNQSVLANTTVPDSQLKKKSNSIAYHFVREGCARDEWRTTYINTHENPADLLTKPLPSGEKRSKFIGMLLWWLGDKLSA